jgi:imidazolonepropionase
METLTGPFDQIITFSGLPLNGPIRDDRLEIIRQGGILTDHRRILATGNFNDLRIGHRGELTEIEGHHVLIPGLIDAHTHLCYAGSRAGDYALRIAGSNYQEILKKGGGIYETVKNTRNVSEKELTDLTRQRIIRHLYDGITTIEIKSGYGLSVEDELKMLEVIEALNREVSADLVPTCLAAHILPPESISTESYLTSIVHDLLPIILKRKLASRVDIFIEENAFRPEESYNFLIRAKNMGFKLTIHADQFTPGGSEVAALTGALSADHLEVINEKNINMLIENDVVTTVLPGASLGLGVSFAPARKILNTGGCLAIASDWNPGSAPMGDLLTEAALLSVYQKLSFAETMSAITFRAARALGMADRGMLIPGKKADFIAFQTADYRDILYNQGKLKPSIIWKDGKKI